MMHLSKLKTAIFKASLVLICPLVLLAGLPQPYELDQGIYNLPEGKLSKNLGTVDFDSARAELSGDAVILSNTRIIDMGVKKGFFDSRPSSNTFLVYETSFSSDIHPKVSAYGALRILVEGGTYTIDVGGLCYSMGAVANIYQMASGQITAFCEGSWGFNNRYRYLEAVRLITTAGVSFSKEWNDLTADITFGGCHRSSRDEREGIIDFKTVQPGRVFFCSPEMTYAVNPVGRLGINAGAYLKTPDYHKEIQINSKQILGRGEIFYTWTPDPSFSLRFCYARSTQTRGFGMLGIKCAVRQ